MFCLQNIFPIKIIIPCSYLAAITTARKHLVLKITADITDENPSGFDWFIEGGTQALILKTQLTMTVLV
jgi:hypothetical protein